MSADPRWRAAIEAAVNAAPFLNRLPHFAERVDALMAPALPRPVIGRSASA